MVWTLLLHLASEVSAEWRWFKWPKIKLALSPWNVWKRGTLLTLSNKNMSTVKRKLWWHVGINLSQGCFEHSKIGNTSIFWWRLVLAENFGLFSGIKVISMISPLDSMWHVLSVLSVSFHTLKSKNLNKLPFFKMSTTYFQTTFMAKVLSIVTWNPKTYS